MAGPVRLQRFLSQAGIASRRAAEELIRAGRVRVNGATVAELGVKVDPEADTIQVDGRRVESAATVWLALHKPRGYVTTRRDPQGRPTIYELLPARFAGLFHVGRLDANSEGLILLTNQGELANRLLHPRYEVERVYDVVVSGDVAPATLRRLRAGVVLEDGMARAHGARLKRAPAPGTSRLELTLREGRKREVRRLMAAVGHPVQRLVRRSYGPIRLGTLRPGAWRYLSAKELASLWRPEAKAKAKARERRTND